MYINPTEKDRNLSVIMLYINKNTADPIFLQLINTEYDIIFLAEN